MEIIDQLFRKIKFLTQKPDNAWKREDSRLPVWVRKAVSKWKQKHPSYKTGSKKVFFGKKYVYKFTWWEEGEWQAPTPFTEFKEKWVRELRRR